MNIGVARTNLDNSGIYSCLMLGYVHDCNFLFILSTFMVVMYLYVPIMPFSTFTICYTSCDHTYVKWINVVAHVFISWFMMSYYVSFIHCFLPWCHVPCTFSQYSCFLMKKKKKMIMQTYWTHTYIYFFVLFSVYRLSKLRNSWLFSGQRNIGALHSSIQWNLKMGTAYGSEQANPTAKSGGYYQVY